MFKIKPWFPEQCNFLGKHILTVKSEWKFCGWSSRKKSCENPFLVSFLFSKWKVTQGFQLRLESTQKLRSRGGHACSRLGKTTIEKQLVNKESFYNIISITPPHFLVLLFYVCSHWIWPNSCIHKFNFFTHLKATHYQITCGLVKNKENKKYMSKFTNKQEANKKE